MDILNFLREEPMMAWYVFLALLVTVVPAASVLWRRIFRRNQAEVAKQPAQEQEHAAEGFDEGAASRQPAQPGIKALHEASSTHFGNQTELVIILVGLMLLLALIGWIRSTFFV